MFFRTLKKSWTEILDNPKRVIVATVSDIVFTLSLFYLITQIWLYTSEAAQNIQAFMQLQGGTSQEVLQQLVAQQDVFWQNYKVIFSNILIFIALFYLLWIIFQGISWYNALRIVKEKVNLLTFYKRFTLYSFILFVLSILIFYLTIQLNVFISKSPVPLLEKGTLQKFIPFIILIIVYFVYALYATIAHKFNWQHYKKIALGKWKRTVPVYLIVLVVFGLLNFGLKEIYGRLPTLFFVLLAVFIVFPLYTYLRIFLINSFKTETKKS